MFYIPLENKKKVFKIVVPVLFPWAFHGILKAKPTYLLDLTF